MKAEWIAMSRTVKGKRYDTRTSRTIKFYSNGLENDHPCYFIEKLCKTHEGDYFLHCAGGEQTIYGGDAKITPITEDDARAWVLNYLGDEWYHDIFMEVTA